MTQMFDVFSIPAERDFPAGALEVRRDALVAVIAADHERVRHPLRAALRAARSRASRVWLAVLGVLAVVLVFTLVLSGGYQSRTAMTSEVVAVVGVAQAVTLLAAPTVRAGRLGSERSLRMLAPAVREARFSA
jgi:hypothetical protein